MREILMETRTGAGEGGARCSFDYYVLVDELGSGGGIACESYGVKIARTEDGAEAAAIPNITTSMARIDELMGLLTRNFVTPTTLKDVVEDWL